VGPGFREMVEGGGVVAEGEGEGEEEGGNGIKLSFLEG